MTVTIEDLTDEGRPAKSVDAVIEDDRGIRVSERELVDSDAVTCVALARAAGAWAMLVVDAELSLASDAEKRTPRRASTSPSVGTAVDELTPRLEGGARRRAFELGAMTYVRGGVMGPFAVFGASPFVTLDIGRGVLLRPALYLGRFTSLRRGADGNSSGSASHGAVRVDMCGRIPGNYQERRGMELDLCGGVEGTLILVDDTEPATSGSGGASRGTRSSDAMRFGVGPSANLRGELGGGLALELRGIVGLNVVSASLAREAAPAADRVTASLLFASAEVGMSWRAP